MTERESAYQEAIHILQLGEHLDFRNVAYRLAKLDPELFVALTKSNVTAAILLKNRERNNGTRI